MGVHHLHPWREVQAQLFHGVFDGLGRIQGISSRGLSDSQTGGGHPVEVGQYIVAFGSNGRLSDITDPDRGTVRVNANRNSGEFFRSLQQVLDHDGRVQALALLGRRPSELAGRNFHVMDPERPDHIFKGEIEFRQFVGVDPDPHGVLGPETFDFTHARHPGQYLFDVRLGIVPQGISVHASIRRCQPDDHQVVPGGFADHDSLALNHVRQTRHGQLELVLDLGPGEVRIGPGDEGQLQARHARRGTHTGDVQQIVETGHLLFYDLGDRILNGLGRSSGIERLDGDGRRGNGRVLGNGHVVDGQTTGCHQRDGDDPGEDRTLQKKS